MRGFLKLFVTSWNDLAPKYSLWDLATMRGNVLLKGQSRLFRFHASFVSARSSRSYSSFGDVLILRRSSFKASAKFVAVSYSVASRFFSPLSSNVPPLSMQLPHGSGK